MIHCRTLLFIAVAALSSLYVPGATAELLFEDDFASGDLSRHNENFRWGRSGEIPDQGSQADQVVTVEGPDGKPVNAIEFSYGTWQEYRFHLTESLEEARTENGASDVAYPELFVRYSLFVPGNYRHRSSGGSGAHNNKGFLTLWKHSYTDGVVHTRTEWWPTPDGRSQLSLVAKSGGGHDRGLDVVGEMYQIDDTNKAYAFTRDEYGTWVHYVFRVRVASGPQAGDGLFEIYTDGTLTRAWYGKDIWPADGNPANAGYDRGYLLGYHNSGYDSTTVFYLTDFAVGTTPGSVGLRRLGTVDVSRRPGAPLLR